MSEDTKDATRGGRLPWLRKERRMKDYKETLSSRMLNAAFITAIFVLLDPTMVVPMGDGQMLKLGGSGFSLDIKGMVIGAIIIEGLKSIKEYWLGTSAAGQKTTAVMERMAEAAAPAATLVAAKALDVATGAKPKAEVTAAEARQILSGKGMSAEDIAALSDAEAIKQASDATLKTDIVNVEAKTAILTTEKGNK